MRLRARFALLACLAASFATLAVGAPRAGAAVDGPTLAADPALTDACGNRPLKDDGTRWECTFVDNFDGTALDTGKWMAQETTISGMTNGPGGCYLNKPWTIAVASGTLRLSAHQTASRIICRSPFGDFRTDLVASTVSTRGRFSQAYGRFAFRARMPRLQVAGAHSALWLYPDRHTYGAWPFSGEIDVAERYSVLPERVYPSLHYVNGLTNVVTGREATVDPTRFHIYALEWTPTMMRFFYDGKLAFEHAWNPLAPLLGSQPFDRPFNVVLTQAWGGLWNGRTEETPDRVTMLVDWVRVWK